MDTATIERMRLLTQQELLVSGERRIAGLLERADACFETLARFHDEITDEDVAEWEALMKPLRQLLAEKLEEVVTTE